MVLGCLFAFAMSMLKRRASKRFVLAESGQDNIWDSSVDNIVIDKNANNTEMSSQSVTASESTTTDSSNNLLTVPKTTVELNQGLK